MERSPIYMPREREIEVGGREGGREEREKCVKMNRSYVERGEKAVLPSPLGLSCLVCIGVEGRRVL